MVGRLKFCTGPLFRLSKHSLKMVHCILFTLHHRRLDPDSRPTFSQILTEFQNPDFKFLLWTAEDVAAYTEEARTLGAPLEGGEELYMDLRQF